MRYRYDYFGTENLPVGAGHGSFKLVFMSIKNVEPLAKIYEANARVAAVFNRFGAEHLILNNERHRRARERHDAGDISASARSNSMFEGILNKRDEQQRRHKNIASLISEM